MPAQYEAIRDKLKKGGMSLKESKKHAAMIYNSKYKKNPVGRFSDKKARGRG
jgi:hypothetical protein